MLVAEVEVWIFARVERDAPAAIHLEGHIPVVGKALDSSKHTVGNLEVIGRRSELDAVPYGKCRLRSR